MLSEVSLLCTYIRFKVVSSNRDQGPGIKDQRPGIRDQRNG